MKKVKTDLNQDENAKKVVLDKTAQKLQRKYAKNRNINNNILKMRYRWWDTLSTILKVVCSIAVTVAIVFFVSIVNCLIQKAPTNFAGFTSIKVGENNIIALSVDTKTLKEDCEIVFYKNSTVMNDFDESLSQEVNTNGIVETKYQITFVKFFGTQSDVIKQCSKDECEIVVRKIETVYDIDGTRWFKTYIINEYGTKIVDDWYVTESLVLGEKTDTFVAKCVATMLGVYTNLKGILLAFGLPFVVLFILLLIQQMYKTQILKLQLDVIEEKRKITDPICVKYDVGFKMKNKMKYKVLAQASDDEKNEYIALLWKNGNAPETIRKYCLRKKMYLAPVEKLLEINRICQQKLNNGVDPSEVADFYLREKEALQKEQLAYERKYRKWVKEDRIDWVSDDELNYDDEKDELNINGTRENMGQDMPSDTNVAWQNNFEEQENQYLDENSIQESAKRDDNVHFDENLTNENVENEDNAQYVNVGEQNVVDNNESVSTNVYGVGAVLAYENVESQTDTTIEQVEPLHNEIGQEEQIDTNVIDSSYVENENSAFSKQEVNKTNENEEYKNGYIVEDNDKVEQNVEDTSFVNIENDDKPDIDDIDNKENNVEVQQATTGVTQEQNDYVQEQSYEEEKPIIVEEKNVVGDIKEENIVADNTKENEGGTRRLSRQELAKMFEEESAVPFDEDSLKVGDSDKDVDKTSKASDEKNEDDNDEDVIKSFFSNANTEQEGSNSSTNGGE